MKKIIFYDLLEGCMEGCVDGCPVGREHRGYIFKQVLRQLVELVRANVLDNDGSVPGLMGRYALVPTIGLVVVANLLGP